MNIEKRHIVKNKNLSGDAYFVYILQEAFSKELLNQWEIENIQLQCLNLLQSKSENYNGGKSSSIKVEAAQSIMKSNHYAIGLYLKSLPDADSAVSELKTTNILQLYKRGRKLINTKLGAAKISYELVKKNKLATINYTYNATLNEGVGSFFTSYNPDYEAQETPASIDYQLCHDVTGLTGVEFIQKYLENLLLENEFCRNFAAEDIHHLLCGYDEGYKDLLINIFEQVLTAAMGCSLANRPVGRLAITGDEIQSLQKTLANHNDQALALKIGNAVERVLEELAVTSLPMRRYIETSLSEITPRIIWSVKTKTLAKTFVSPLNPDLEPSIRFFSGGKMDDQDYRKLINELLICRYSSDKIAIIKEKVKSFSDLEDVLLDARLSEKESAQVLGILGDVEIAALIKRHPYQFAIEAVQLTEAEQSLRLSLKRYVEQLAVERREKILAISDQLIED